MIRLHRNESGLDHLESTLQLMLESEDLRFYFREEVEEELLNLLSQYANLPKTHLMLANGSTNFLRLIANLYIHGAEDEVVSFWPTYVDFVDFVKFQDGTLKLHHFGPEDRDFLMYHEEKYKLIEYLITPKTKLIYLCSPNNPIDFLWTSDEVAHLCQKYPEIPILVDQAYYEFQTIGDPIMSWAGTKYQNLLVIKSFSKAFGLAGIRLGYCGAHPELIRQMSERYKTKEVNSLAKKVGIHILKNQDYYQEQRKATKATRKWTAKELNRLGLTTWESQTNFLLVKVGKNTKELTEYLKKQRILIKDVNQSPYEITGHIRISIASQEEMEILIKVLEEYYLLKDAS